MSNQNTEITDLDALKTWALSSTLNFTRYTFKHRFKKRFVIGDHHRQISEVLDRVLSGELKRVIINIAPRYSKTEMCVKNFIAMGLALNPAAKFIHLSYSDDLVRDNSTEIQSIMNEDCYTALFDARPTSTNSRKWYTEQKGGLYAVSSSGQVTGFGAGIVDDQDALDIALDELEQGVNGIDFGGAIVIDDPIKPDDALSEKIRGKVNNKFDTTIRNRVNSRNTPIIIIMQRVHENDLCGFLLENEKEDWHVLSLPCITTDKNGEEKALWEFKHTLEELKKLREVNSHVFDTQYMQNPTPLEGLMYESPFKTYSIVPASKRITRKAYVDTADTGSDYLCAIIYDETEIGNYVVDVLYTKKSMEHTEPALAVMLTKHKVQKCIVESNNGGRSFQRAVEKECRNLNNNKTSFTWFHQSDNKIVRIFTKSAEVNNIVYMPEKWDKLFPEFHKSITTYRKENINEYDDAEDALTGTVEKRMKNAVDLSKLNQYAN